MRRIRHNTPLLKRQYAGRRACFAWTAGSCGRPSRRSNSPTGSSTPSRRTTRPASTVSSSPQERPGNGDDPTLPGRHGGGVEDAPALAAAVREELARLRTKEALDADVPATREQLIKRLAAALEGQGDCNLFADRPDLAEASDDYRQAILVYGNLPDTDDSPAGLTYKRAIALALPSPVQDLDLAAALVQEASTADPMPSRWVAFHAKTAEALVGCFGPADGRGKAPAQCGRRFRTERKNSARTSGATRWSRSCSPASCSSSCRSPARRRGWRRKTTPREEPLLARRPSVRIGCGRWKTWTRCSCCPAHGGVGRPQ